ncbi:MAG: TlpA disulfide reductase family protein [Rhodothermales bacterium]
MDSTIVLWMGMGMIAVGAGFLYVLFKDNPARRPRDLMEWTGTVLSVLLIVAAAALIAVSRQTGSNAAEGQATATPSTFQDMIIEAPAGNFSFTGLDSGATADLDAYRGKVVLLNFWATWCAPCLEEIPALNRLQKKYGEDGFVVLSISDEDPGILKAFEAQLPLDTESVYVDFGMDLPVPFRGAFDIRPTSFVVDREGTVRRYILGNRPYDFFETAIQPYL